MTIHHQFNRGGSIDGDDAAIERQIAALGGSIAVGSRHRQRVLEQASDSVGRLHGKVRSAQVTIAMSVLLVLISPLVAGLTRVKAPAAVTAEQTNAAALRHAEASRMSFDWALVDIFQEFRRSKQSDR